MAVKPVTAATYRKDVYKVVTNPVSGYSFKIKRPDPEVMLNMLGLLPPGKTNPEDITGDPVFRENLPKVLSTLIPNCVIEPKVTLEETHPDSELHLSEVSFGDSVFLMGAILEFAGLSGAAAKKRKTFRK